ncbi:MAG: hypothetical protein ACYCOO_03770 [Chitinophagaceae bacterium]
MGWMVGWEVENKHPYFFVTQIETQNRNAHLQQISETITRDILRSTGFFKGNK